MKPVAIGALTASLLLTACVPVSDRQTPVLPVFATARIGEAIELGGRTITPVALAEDSRCPANVLCVQAGTVRLQMRIKAEGKDSEAMLGLDEPVQAGRPWLHLLAACPARATPAPVSESAYRFTFALAPVPENSDWARAAPDCAG